MDLNALRTIATVASFIAFMGIAWWAYSQRNAGRFEEAAQLPFEHEDALPDASQNEESK